MSFTATDEVDLTGLDEVLASCEGVSSNDLIRILQEIQQAYSYLPPEVLKEMSRRTGIPISRVYGVATFYEQFYLEPHGRHTVKCCRGTACHVKGGWQIIDTIQRALAVGPGETTEDMEFTFETVACLGTCALAPVMVIDGVYYGKMTHREVNKVLDNIRTAETETA